MLKHSQFGIRIFTYDSPKIVYWVIRCMWFHFRIFGPFWVIYGLFRACFDLFWAFLNLSGAFFCPLWPILFSFSAILESKWGLFRPFRAYFDLVWLFLTCWSLFWAYLGLFLLFDLFSNNIIIPGSIFGTLKGMSPDFWSQKTRSLGLTRDLPESQFPVVNTDNVD